MNEQRQTIPHDTARPALEEIGRLADGTLSIAGELRATWLDEFGHEDLLDLALIGASDAIDSDPRIDRHMLSGRRVHRVCRRVTVPSRQRRALSTGLHRRCRG